ncbi:MAG: CheR family methyltransferase, partial [Ignavibacteria bacterium]
MENKTLKKQKTTAKKNTGTFVTRASHKLFPVVAIGASAGGLDAYTRILLNIHTDTGMAFVIIQHLSPDYKSMLKDILNRKTEMEVITIRNNMKPEPNKVYVLPPTYSAQVRKGIFLLKHRGKRLHVFKPADIFMQSLAEDDVHFPIGIVLSGGDSDGMIGMDYIKKAGGITYAQDMTTAKFTDMPQNSISAGVVDFVMSPENIARDLNRISSNEHFDITKYHEGWEDDFEMNVKKILSMVLARKNIDFRNYKPGTVKRRILRRIVIRKLKNISEYVKFLENNSVEIDALSSDILIKITKFFRDQEMYKTLKQVVFPKIFKNGSNHNVRIWVTACSSGEETYSMAMSVAEYLGPKISRYNLQIFSTDLNEAGLDKARRGVYDEDIAADVSEERLKNFFTKTGKKYKINKKIREFCVFARQNFIQDPPFSKMDLISCRNVLIYMDATLQKKAIPIFHYALKDGGYLVLGSSESVGTWKNLFETIDRKHKLFLKKTYSFENGYDHLKKEIFNLELSNHYAKPVLNNYVDFHKEIERIMIEKYSPSGVIIDKHLNVLHFKGSTGDYIDMPEGPPVYNILKMAKKDLVPVLRSLLKESVKNNKSIRRNNIKFPLKNEIRNINIIIEPVSSNSSGQKTYMVLFENPGNSNLLEDALDFHVQKAPEGTNQRGKTELARITKELATGKENLQIASEKQEATNEELQSSNEELQSTNEELQSTNEELETMKEELQSSNEELLTVNDEMRLRNTQLATANSDLNNILSSIMMSIVIVDHSLRIKRFTKDAGKLMNIIPSDIGRKITDINPNISISNLKELIKGVIDTPESKEKEVKDKNNYFYSMRIR